MVSPLFRFPLVASSSPSVILEADFIIFGVLLSNIIPQGRDSDGAYIDDISEHARTY